MPSKVWDEITNPFANFNGCTVEVWEWVSNFIPNFKMDVISYPCQDQSDIPSHEKAELALQMAIIVYFNE